MPMNLVLVADSVRGHGVRGARQRAGDGGREGVRQHLFFFRERKTLQQNPLICGVYDDRRVHCVIYRPCNAFYKKKKLILRKRTVE